MRAPLYDAVAADIATVRLHTPGHKGRLGGIFGQISRCDLTELSRTDDLYAPTGPIAEAESLATDFFGTENTVFSAGGATLCIQTALSFFRGKKILFDRNSHVSAFNAASALDIEPEYICGGFDNVPLPPTPEQADDYLARGGFSALYITSPNYYGVCADIKGLKEVCTAHNAALITDNAHGSHLFVTDKDNSACVYSDICIDSAHKTLPVLTGGAYLHVGLGIEKRIIKQNMRYFGSTSPSFPILASLDLCRCWLEEKGKEELTECVTAVSELKKSLESIGISILRSRQEDAMRLCVLVNDGKGLGELLEDRGIYPEMAAANTVVMLFSPFNTNEDFGAVLSFFKTLPFSVGYTRPSISVNLPVRAMNYKDAFFAEKETVPINNSVGRTAAENILPYPPGIPVTAAGEIITEKAAGIAAEYGKKTISVVKREERI